MNYYYLTFRSVTHAQRGEKVLQRENLRCSLQRTPRWMEEKGCGYSLHLPGGDVIAAEEILRQNAVPVRKVYARKADGTMEELAL